MRGGEDAKWRTLEPLPSSVNSGTPPSFKAGVRWIQAVLGEISLALPSPADWSRAVEGGGSHCGGSHENRRRRALTQVVQLKGRGSLLSAAIVLKGRNGKGHQPVSVVPR